MSPCRRIKLGDSYGFVCGHFSRSRAKPKCSVCGMPADYLCDGPVGRATCDAPICADHRKNIGPDVDLCPICVLRLRRE